MLYYNQKEGDNSQSKGEMKMYYWFTFADGYEVCTRGFSKQEMRVEERKHGKLMKKERA